MIITRLKELGDDYESAPLEIMSFHSAARTGNLVFTSGQISRLGDLEIKGKVGAEIDLDTARKAAEICAYSCLRAAGAIADIETITRIVKLTGFVNAADGFDRISEVINGASDFLTAVFGDKGPHARSAIGAHLPSDWAVEVEMVLEVT